MEKQTFVVTIRYLKIDDDSPNKQSVDSFTNIGIMNDRFVFEQDDQVHFIKFTDIEWIKFTNP